MKTIAEVGEFIASNGRTASHVRLLHAQLYPGDLSDDVPNQANLLVRKWGYSVIAAQSWSVLNCKAASDIASRMLGEDLAYKRELMPRKTAEYCAGSLAKALSPHKARFLCNAEFQGGSVTWDPIGDSTFEVALVGFDDCQAFLLYAQAED